MFEVDWADYDCERVGQRRARKEVERERKKKEDASSHHETISSRTSCSSDQRHRSFFGSISRKKAIPPSPVSQNQDTTNSRLSAAGSSLKRGSIRFHHGATNIATSIAEASMEPQTDVSAIRPPAEGSTGSMNRGWPETPDRSSNGIYQAAHRNVLGPQTLTQDPESMLSKMTELTIPMSESQGDGPITEATRPMTRIVQALDEDGSCVVKTVRTTHQLGRSKPASWLGVETKITSTPKTPRTPRLPPPSHTLSSPDSDDKSASEFIDDWFSALHGPARQLPRPGLNGAIPRGNVFLPPSLYRPVPTTPTRRSAKRDAFIPPSPSPIRFSTDNPDDWKTPDEWNRTSPTATPVPAPADNKTVARDEEDEESLDSIAAHLSSLSIENQTRDVAQASRDDENSPGLPTEKAVKAPPRVYCQFQWKGATTARGRGTAGTA